MQYLAKMKKEITFMRHLLFARRERKLLAIDWSLWLKKIWIISLSHYRDQNPKHEHKKYSDNQELYKARAHSTLFGIFQYPTQNVSTETMNNIGPCWRFNRDACFVHCLSIIQMKSEPFVMVNFFAGAHSKRYPPEFNRAKSRCPR